VSFFYYRPCDADPRAADEKEQGRLTGETKSGEDVQGVNGELAPVMNVGDGVVDDAQRTTVTSNLWSLMAGASRGDDEGWLEATAASVVIGGLEKLREKARQAINRCYRERGKGGGTRGEEGMLHRIEIDSDWRRKLRAPASDSSSLAAPNREGKGGERREGGWAL
jgi:hypothetical protein